MGVGHVPACPVCQECQGHDVPRHKHRGTRADLGSVEHNHRRALGALGERIASRFLVDHGASIVGRNVRVGRGEIDLIVTIGGRRIAVEVKTASGDADPVHHFDQAKATQVRSLANQCGVHRVDYVGVGISPGRALVRWLPAVG